MATIEECRAQIASLTSKNSTLLQLVVHLLKKHEGGSIDTVTKEFPTLVQDVQSVLCAGKNKDTQPSEDRENNEREEKEVKEDEKDKEKNILREKLIIEREVVVYGNRVDNDEEERG